MTAVTKRSIIEQTINKARADTCFNMNGFEFGCSMLVCIGTEVPIALVNTGR